MQMTIIATGTVPVHIARDEKSNRDRALFGSFMSPQRMTKFTDCRTLAIHYRCSTRYIARNNKNGRDTRNIYSSNMRICSIHKRMIHARKAVLGLRPIRQCVGVWSVPVAYVGCTGTALTNPPTGARRSSLLCMLVRYGTTERT